MNRKILFVLLVGLFGFNINHALADDVPRVGFDPTDFALACNCAVTPPRSICGDDDKNACGSGKSCADLCKQAPCADVQCMGRSGGGAPMFYCNTKNQAAAKFHNNHSGRDLYLIDDNSRCR